MRRAAATSAAVDSFRRMRRDRLIAVNQSSKPVAARHFELILGGSLDGARQLRLQYGKLCPDHVAAANTFGTRPVRYRIGLKLLAEPLGVHRGTGDRAGGGIGDAGAARLPHWARAGSARS